MKITKDTNFLIIGLGVMGGSYAEALSLSGYRVFCITKRQEDIDYALSHKMIQGGSTEVTKDIIEKADIIVFAIYPGAFVEWIKEYGNLILPKTLITDVTGIKTEIVEKVQNMLPQGVEFIAAHPMAGREKSGVEYADSTVFRGANYIITPTNKNTDEGILTCRELGEILGFQRISLLSPKEHDRMIAFLSQLTHCIAVSLMNSETADGLEKFTGDSFRDLTRIAKINDEMWSELFLRNRDALLIEMDSFEKEFSSLRNMINEGDREGLREKMRNATNRRTLFDKPKN